MTTCSWDTQLADSAAALGMTEVGQFDAGPYSLTLAYPPDADLDGLFPALCLDTGEKLEIRGWLFTHDPLA
ncbi:MAG: hypothetical protein ACRER5_23075 [Pseudomonas sp.]